MTTPAIARLAWVTTRAVRGLDEDEPAALASLERTGVAVDVVDWDDPEVDWAAYDRVALRSTWDYTDRLAEFVAWLERVDAVSQLANPLEAVRWSLDKRYLRDLDEAGVPVTETTFVPVGTTAQFPPGHFVVKPAVGAGSRGTASFGPDEHEGATAHVARLHASGQVVLVQPFVASVATDGEWPLVFLAGEFSHAANKRVTLAEQGSVDELFVAEDNAPHAATDEQVAVAQAAVDWVGERFGPLAFVRVDLVRADDGTSRVLEVELVEPSLFLPYADAGATDRLAAALVG